MDRIKEMAVKIGTTIGLTQRFLILLYLTGFAPPVLAQTSTLDARPLVRIETRFTEIPPPPPQLETTEFTFISRGGYVFKQSGIRAATGTLDGAVGRGFANTSQRAAIRDILSRGQIGLRQDCVRISARLSGDRRITWFGRNGRSHSFRYVEAADLSSGLPACSEQANDLLEELESIAGIVVTEGGEFFVTPPGP
jgi:hypothetical protein